MNDHGSAPLEISLKFGMLRVVWVHTDQDVLSGKEYLRRARLSSLQKSDNEALDFYSKPENRHFIPEIIEGEANGRKKGVSVDCILFPDTEFADDGRHWVRCLTRFGGGWSKEAYCVGNNFDRSFLVAVVV